jgi:hypothetical protein
MPMPKGSRYPADRHYKTHGWTRITKSGKRKTTKEYAAWQAMKGRCHNTEHDEYHRYGGRGIEVCERWRRSFEAFLADVGEAPSRRHTLERRENNGHYEPGNVVWATRKEQARNRRTCKVIEIGGKRQCLSAWAEELGITPNALRHRIRRGVDPSTTIAQGFGR